MPTQTVNPADRAMFGIPEACPDCGGELGQAFAVKLDDAGIRRPMIDPTVARCRDCCRLFPVATRSVAR